MDGSVLIEGVDTATLPLATLRSSLSLIQQESTLIRGTIRSNLIPMAKLADEELLSALRAVGLESAVVQAGGLGARRFREAVLRVCIAGQLSPSK